MSRKIETNTDRWELIISDLRRKNYGGELWVDDHREDGRDVEVGVCMGDEPLASLDLKADEALALGRWLIKTFDPALAPFASVEDGGQT